MSLRWKITLMTVMAVLLTLVVSALLVRQMINISEEHRLRDEATASLQQAVKILDETGISVLGAKVNDPNLPADAMDAAQQGQVVTYRGTLENVPVVFAAAPVELGSQPAVLSLSVSWANSLQVRSSVDTALLWAGIATLILVSTVGILFATRLVKRLWLGAMAARSISSGQREIAVGQAIGKPFAGKDEVDQFAAAVDAMAAELKSKIAAEQRFSADLAHELRTPLTGLVTAASLLEPSRPAELVQDRVDKLRTLVEDLLEVSRLESGIDSAELVELPLDACVSQILERIGARNASALHDVEVQLNAPEQMVWVDARRLERILENVLNNAHAHGTGPVVVQTGPGSIEILDHGTGFPNSILATGPERFVSKGGGIGLGLTIASGQAAVMGAKMRLSNKPGASVVLHLRRSL
ncbi:HAMP domain-containing sensor histidine kinase [Glutamicibacter sp.]|uniref:sensor histidine kinase n=1 Tax=Glutamicibacter sp. TaxID=1931995 RepID=UPI0028BD6669|nr:HAMP domain-containing sensor histidine kinase [Glutamicibacter sp.]